jgi:hypothetical protein
LMVLRMASTAPAAWVVVHGEFLGNALHNLRFSHRAMLRVTSV